MKDTLQLHELAGYLPYGLKRYCPSSNVLIHEYTPLDFIQSTLDMHNGFGWKPILYPASELLSTDDKQYSPIAIIVMHTDQHCDAYDKWAHSYLDNPEPSKLLQAPYEVIQELYKQHYDIHNLIGRGLAISVHDIDKAP